jgi:hypothetical protein
MKWGLGMEESSIFEPFVLSTLLKLESSGCRPFVETTILHKFHMRKHQF